MSEGLLQSFRDTFGAGIIGSLLSMGIYGLTTSQTYFYFSEYPNDKPWTRRLVGALWALNTLQSTLMIHMVYHYLILSAFNFFELSRNIWSLPVSMIVHLIMAVLVMTYFLNVIFQCMYRDILYPSTIPILTYSRQQEEPLVVGVAVLVYIGFGIETIIDLFKTPSLVDLAAFTKISFLPMAATQAGADTTIAASLCFVLFNHRSGFRRTNSLIYTLIMYAINRCVLTAGTALVALFMIALKPNSMIYIGPQFLISGLYTNALLASLNSRNRIQGDGVVDFNSVHLSIFEAATRPSRAGDLNTSSDGIQLWALGN
ncbi:hypothetical protein DFH06DRAFT_1471479 [Mycena polygramma]|nr:hypothetical protein DFH06DRAFT_1471479 [Mycena polygramma]